MTRTPKEFIKLFGPLALGIIVVSSWFLYSGNQSHLERVGERQDVMVTQVTRILTRSLSSHAADAQFLARLVGHRLSEAHGPLRGVEDAFTDFARSRLEYFQIRYIDETGAERVRVDRSFTGPVISPPSALQHKGGRYYFKETMRAGRGDVYMSRFDLNVEHGRIEIPLVPTLRFGSPVLDANGTKRGIIVLNLDGKALFERIRQQAETGDGVTMLCNGQGYWILGPSQEDAWGHLLEERKDASMPNRFPEAWRVMASRKSMQVETPHGLFTFDTIGMVPGAVLSEMPPSAEESRQRWKVLTWVPPEALAVSWTVMFIVLNVCSLVLLAIGCWYLADYRVRQSDVEARLRENEERTLAISQSAQDAIVMIDQGDRITHWNPAAEKLFGYRKEEVVGLGLHDLIIPGELRSAAKDGLVQFAATGHGRVVGQLLEFEGVRKDGSTVPVEMAISSFQFKGQWYAVGSLRDITRRKKHELQLRRSEETSRALINAPTESAMLIEPTGTIVAINETGAKRLGGTVNEMIGKNAFDLVTPAAASRRRSAMMDVVETGEPVNFEDARGGRTMHVSVYPVKGPDRSVERLAIFVRDVTEQRHAEAALRLSEQRFRDVSEAVGEYIWETDEEGRFTFVTEDVFHVLGYTRDELVGSKPYKLLPENDVEGYQAWRQNVYSHHEPFANMEIRNVTKGGQIIWLQVSGVPFFDDAGIFQGFRGAAMNITDRKDAEQALKASERRLRALAESAYDAIIMIDTNGLVSFWNDAAVQLFGFTEAEALGSNVHELLAPEEDIPKAEIGMYQFALTGDGPAVGAVQEVMARRKDGTIFPVERSVAGFRLGRDWYAVATIHDITERKATEAKLRELATTDSLTGLSNRRRFMELSEREYARSLRYGSPLGLLMLDIDHFKNVNDTYGHDVGDQVLRSLSEISIMALRNADILGRLGGEEFGVLLPETDGEAAMEVAERLRRSIEHTRIDIHDGSLNITVSVGVAVMDDATESIADLLKRADVALYDAKQSGRNCVVSG